MVPLDSAARDQPTVPAGSARRRSRWWIAALAAGFLAVIVIAAAVIPVPYIALRPGSARPVADQITVEDAESFPPEQSLAFTTVNVGSVSLLEALGAWLDPEVDVLPEERVRGGRSADETRRYNVELMDTSKLIAIAVAQEYLGEDVKIRTSGTVVDAIAEGSPAAEVLELDDVIVAVDGEAVDVPGELGDLLQEGGPGATHALTVERPPGTTRRVEVDVTTVATPDDPDRAVIGIVPKDRVVDFDLPIDVTIDSGNVGGPSAGLAFTLAVLDVLTPGELTGGKRVAATGTMSLDQRVGPVGGGPQKAVTVRDAGYDVFLVPTEEFEQVRDAVGDDLQVIGVDTLDDALAALAALGGNADSLALPKSEPPP